MEALFNKEGYVFPNDWEELFHDWVWSSPMESEVRKIMSANLGERDLNDLPPIPRDYFLQWAKEETQRLTAKEEVEKLKNLPHKLCILYDLGILDLIEERFSYKNHKGTAPQTDKAKLIASLLQIDDPESVRLCLKNKEYLTGKAKSNAVETLKMHGLEPKKLTD